MGTLIAIAICLFVIGSIMSLKPSPIEKRLDSLRMTARSLDLSPKLLAYPKWLRGKDNEYGKGMVAYYSVVNDALQLPLSHYQVIDNQWRPVEHELITNTDFTLDKFNIDFPKSIKGHVKAVFTQANCITLIWEDANYVRPTTNKDFDIKNIKPDLSMLKENLETLASMIANSQPK